MTQEALKQALDALETSQNYVQASSYAGYGNQLDKADEAIAALKEALAQPEQEPVAWMWKDMRGQEIVSLFEPRLNSVPLYTHLPQRTWVGLAKEDHLCAKYMQDAPDGIEAVIDYIEAKLKEKNT
jgi:hypothetical protein